MRKDHAIHSQSWIRTIVSKGKWYLFSSILVKGINIILIPIYTRYLTTQEYGILNSLNAVSQLLPIFISLYLDSAFGRFFHDVKKSPAKLSALFSTVFWFVTGFGLIVITLTILSANLWMPGLIKVPVWPYAYLAFIPPLFLQLGQLGIVFLRQSLLAKQTTLVEIISTILLAGATLPLLMLFNLGVQARLIGGLLASLFVFVFYTLYFIRSGILRPIFNGSILIKCLAYSLPLIPNIAGGWIAQLSDRLILAKYASLEAVGVYSLGFQLAMVLYFLQDAITQVTGPLSISGLVHDRKKTKKKISKFLFLILSVMLTGHMMISLFSSEAVTLLASQKYQDASRVIGIIGFAYVLSSLYRVFSDILSFHRKTWIISVSGIIMGVVNLGLNLILVPRFGYTAAAYSFTVSILSYLIILFAFSQRYEKLNIYWREILTVFGVYLVMIVFANLFLLRGISLQLIAIKSLLILGYGCLILMLRPRFNTIKTR